MLVVLADTHSETGPELTAHLRTQIDDAEGLLHAGDFTTEQTLDVFESLASSFWGVTGNSDTAGVAQRLPETQVVERFGQRILLVHGHRHDETALGLLGRQEQADIVVVGHTHRPGIETVGGMTVVNPGSHADPRGHRPAYARIAATEDGVRVWLRTIAGADLDSALV